MKKNLMSDNQEQKKIILSGIQPSNYLSFGVYAGALTNWLKFQDEFDTYFMVADLHAITLRQVPAELRKRTLDTVAMYIACGIDPKKSTLFLQSHIPAHSQLTWVLNCFTGMGECMRMTQFKEKSKKNEENINVGLFSYPILMATDILLYQADLVPVGKDQKQHLELTRNLAQRFNHHYSDTFKVPEPYIPKIGAKIMSLQDPTKKMSKSDDNLNATLFLNDDDETIKRKIKRAITDSDSNVKLSDNKPGVSNLMSMYNIATGKTFENIEKEFEGVGYGEFKLKVAESIAQFISPIRDKFEEIRNNKKYLNEVLEQGREKASRKAMKTLSKVNKKVGFYQI